MGRGYVNSSSPGRNKVCYDIAKALVDSQQVVTGYVLATVSLFNDISRKASKWQVGPLLRGWFTSGRWSLTKSVLMNLPLTLLDRLRDHADADPICAGIIKCHYLLIVSYRLSLRG